MYRLLPLPFFILGLLWATTLAAAQFQFFDQMFGQQQHHQQQQQQQHSGGGGGASQWAANVESVSCTQFLCPNTLECVAAPHDCSCPDLEDVKCIIPDADNKNVGTVLCARGPDACQAVEKVIWRLAGQ
ncbi:hypothetical protein D9757_001338 [Collybiopsis confluens]|uniref:Long chronological lifespan protein 2 n=1 Tax=Collybiopsis confluens TaxID=2823264 RepID=A0A8H5MGC7_9AGAR|nr:hypothetical protein D9757_001338 [Collybiopsis confluens]